MRRGKVQQRVASHNTNPKRKRGPRLRFGLVLATGTATLRCGILNLAEEHDRFLT